MVRHFQVEGRVQGVGFRWFVHREAAQIGLNGWVRNTDAGHVEAVAGGSSEQLAQIESAMRRGSRGSRVDRVLVHDLTDAEGETLGPFQIDGAF